MLRWSGWCRPPRLSPWTTTPARRRRSPASSADRSPTSDRRAGRPRAPTPTWRRPDAEQPYPSATNASIGGATYQALAAHREMSLQQHHAAPGTGASRGHRHQADGLVDRRVLRAVLEAGEVAAGLVGERRLLRHHGGQPAQRRGGLAGEVEHAVGAVGVQPDPQVVLVSGDDHVVDAGDRAERPDAGGQPLRRQRRAEPAAEADDEVDPGDRGGVLTQVAQGGEHRGAVGPGCDVELEVVVGSGADGEDAGLGGGAHGRSCKHGGGPCSNRSYAMCRLPHI